MMGLGSVLPKSELDDDVSTSLGASSEDQSDRASPLSVREQYAFWSIDGVLGDIGGVRSRVREFDLCHIDDMALRVFVHFTE